MAAIENIISRSSTAAPSTPASTFLAPGHAGSGHWVVPPKPNVAMSVQDHRHYSKTCHKRDNGASPVSSIRNVRFRADTLPLSDAP